MYLHLGSHTVIRKKHIVGIFDLETTSVSTRTKIFLKKAQDSGEVYNVSSELPAAFVLMADPQKGTRCVYISPLSAATLRKRALAVQPGSE